ncbi:Uncharacterized conserved protein (plasmid) [Legionella adelaidensis]|uniref:Uncharacterized conserved protein n=1 Tax=Legionella adelaidensis TaxID=45056 RepID=A0A0W0R324_9GAMM|nr:secondary thiamine-phosphate synthase enzyme YjbQ [Legionella adelaidensis]KTC65472.1 hypothetical protein Lade_0130 [Legionella adelaidensis]VEH84707.1 Uncharacterized conserved protein [Legionella adelaidensis]
MNKITPIYWQTTCVLPQKKRGFHLITREIQETIHQMPFMQIGTIHLFLQHTSASLTISENACEEVRVDLERFFTRLIPEDNTLYQHTVEGVDDMPAHIKNVILGVSLTIPIKDKALLLGEWQGIYLCEHRNKGGQRKIIITATGYHANPIET